MSHSGVKIDWQDLAWENGFRSSELQGDDKSMFTQWYNEENMTMETIGERIGICATTVSRRMRDLGIKIEPKRNNNCGRGPRFPGRKR